MQSIFFYMQLTGFNANVEDDAENMENQQQFNEAMHTIKLMNFPASSKV